MLYLEHVTTESSQMSLLGLSKNLALVAKKLQFTVL